MHICCVFFQAEDGIRDSSVTGVQTCALPIYTHTLTHTHTHTHTQKNCLRKRRQFFPLLSPLSLSLFRLFFKSVSLWVPKPKPPEWPALSGVAGNAGSPGEDWDG